tara:strand:+ start:630 stop:1016 length:387 start_codon:yes stop_codon:yes gene_type:complete
MLKSVNQSWAIGSKFRDRYGSTWADMDFFFKDKISAKNFKNDPMNISIGSLQLAGMSVPFKYKDLIKCSKLVTKMSFGTHRANLSEKFEIDIKSKTFLLNRQELNRLRETLDDVKVTVHRSYELGLYL